MKKLFVIIIAFVCAFSVFSCAGNVETPSSETTETTASDDIYTTAPETEPEETVPEGDYITIIDDDGNPYYLLELYERVDISSFSIVRPEDASETLNTAVSTLRDGIIAKTGAELDVVNDWPYEQDPERCEIFMYEGTGAAKDFYEEQYALEFRKNKVHILAGSGEAMMNAVQLFLNYFIDVENSKVIMTDQYYFLGKYFVSEITVDGVPISDFDITFDPDDYAIDTPEVISEKIAEELSDEFIFSNHTKAFSYTDRMMRGKHYIVISAHSLDVDSYSVSVENGNIYVRGSYYSIDEAVNLLLEFLHASRYVLIADRALGLKLTSADNVSRELDFTVPYTKTELLAAFSEAQSRDDMIISGAHAFNWRRSSNGIAVGPTLDLFYNNFGDVSTIMEFDLGKYSVLSPENNNEEGLSEYDISKLVSDCADHVAKGGIISISAHTINPLDPSGGFRGGINSNDLYKEIFTEGTELNKNYLLSISPVMRVLKAFHDNGIPVIYRPFHEMTGDWFWWCIYQPNGIVIEADIWTGLWKYLHNHVTNELGLDNVLWSYAAAGKNALYPYPGDEYVDIVGIDWYTGGNREVKVEDGYPLLMTSGKPIGLTEFGGPAPSTGYSCESMLLDLKWMMEEGLDVDFFVLWTTNGSFVGMQKGDVLFGDPIIYTRNDMLKYWNR